MLLQIQDYAADYIDAKETAVKALKQDRIPCRRPCPHAATRWQKDSSAWRV